jgi:hypothetical protein
MLEGCISSISAKRLDESFSLFINFSNFSRITVNFYKYKTFLFVKQTLMHFCKNVNCSKPIYNCNIAPKLNITHYRLSHVVSHIIIVICWYFTYYTTKYYR